MEKFSEYLMWTTKRNQLKPNKLKQSSMEDEDEDDEVVRAWPPRSYSCSFCNREFRSAQALGGHMNVHRRDRAKLKQSNNTSNTIAAVAPQPISSATIFFQENSGDHQQKGCKRRRVIGGCGNTVSFVPVKLHESDEEVQVVAGMRSSKNSSMEEIDLELRVGVK